MNSQDIIELAVQQLHTLSGKTFDVFSIAKPVSTAAAQNLARILSKLSPLVGNLIEFNIVELLNDQASYGQLGEWVRQDPGFPDAIFQGSIEPVPGFEIKAWFPLSTEITARFKDSQNYFATKNIHVVLIAWVPEFVVYGKPRLLDVQIIEAGSIAYARDVHYHRPPDYLVVEPEDTSSRTRNLQQTNTNGYKWQGNEQQRIRANQLVDSWGSDSRQYQTSVDYQQLMRQLLNEFAYRVDTNYAKIDRIAHTEIEAFKTRVLAIHHAGLPVAEWGHVLRSKNDTYRESMFHDLLKITDVDADSLVE